MPTLSQEIKSLQAEVNDIEALFAAGNAFQEAAQKLKGNGSATVQLDFPVINTVKDQNKDYTVTEFVTDEEGNKVVEENNYKDNPSQTVKVDEADGHTEVQDKEITPETTTVTDKFFYEGLVKGDTYTVKITQAYDHNLKKSN